MYNIIYSRYYGFLIFVLLAVKQIYTYARMCDNEAAGTLLILTDVKYQVEI